MPISTVCGDCQKKYTVKDEMAGKRFRCKECQTIVTVPDAIVDEEQDEDDPFGGVDLQSAGKAIRKRRRVEEEDDDDDGDDEEENPYRSPKSKSKPVKKKRSRGVEMPASAIVAITCQCLLVMFHVLNSALVAFGEDANAAHKTGTIIGALFRLTIAISILTGLLQRKDNSRQWSRGLSILGLVVCGIAVATLIGVAPKTDENIGIIIVLIFQMVMWITLVISLSTESAADWFKE